MPAMAEGGRDRKSDEKGSAFGGALNWAPYKEHSSCFLFNFLRPKK